MPDPTAQDLRARGHPYRNFHPHEVRTVFQSQGMDAGGSVLGFIEGGRFDPFLESLSEFFFKLDDDEKELFTQRNPDAVQWMSVWNDVEGLNPYPAFDAAADSLLTATMTDSRVGMPERTFERVLPESYEPPPFQRKSLDHDTLVRDMASRRRSYRNWTPGEFLDVASREHEIGRGLRQEVGLGSPRQTLTEPGPLPDVPAPGEKEEVEGKLLGRMLLKRVEAGRFEPVLSTGWLMFVKLDPDEAMLFARRNPGLVEWFAAWGVLEEVIFGPKGLLQLSDVAFPLVAERKSNPHGETTAAIRQRIRERAGLNG